MISGNPLKGHHHQNNENDYEEEQQQGRRKQQQQKVNLKDVVEDTQGIITAKCSYVSPPPSPSHLRPAVVNTGTTSSTAQQQQTEHQQQQLEVITEEEGKPKAAKAKVLSLIFDETELEVEEMVFRHSPSSSPSSTTRKQQRKKTTTDEIDLPGFIETPSGNVVVARASSSAPSGSLVTTEIDLPGFIETPSGNVVVRASSAPSGSLVVNDASTTTETDDEGSLLLRPTTTGRQSRQQQQQQQQQRASTGSTATHQRPHKNGSCGIFQQHSSPSPSVLNSVLNSSDPSKNTVSSDTNNNEGIVWSLLSSSSPNTTTSKKLKLMIDGNDDDDNTTSNSKRKSSVFDPASTTIAPENPKKDKAATATTTINDSRSKFPKKELKVPLQLASATGPVERNISYAEEDEKFVADDRMEYCKDSVEDNVDDTDGNVATTLSEVTIQQQQMTPSFVLDLTKPSITPSTISEAATLSTSTNDNHRDEKYASKKTTSKVAGNDDIPPSVDAAVVASPRANHDGTNGTSAETTSSLSQSHGDDSNGEKTKDRDGDAQPPMTKSTDRMTTTLVLNLTEPSDRSLLTASIASKIQPNLSLISADTMVPNNDDNDDSGSSDTAFKTSLSSHPHIIYSGAAKKDTTTTNKFISEKATTTQPTLTPSTVSITPSTVLSIAAPSGEVRPISQSDSRSEAKTITGTACPNNSGGKVVTGSMQLPSPPTNNGTSTSGGKLSLASPSGEVRALIPPPRSAIMATPQSIIPDGQVAYGVNVDEENQIQDQPQPSHAGAFRIGTTGSNSNGSIEMNSTHNVESSTFIKGAPIIAELVDQEQPLQVVESMVQERIRQRDRELTVAQVAQNISSRRGSDFMIEVRRKQLYKTAMSMFLLVAIASVIVLTSVLVSKFDEDTETLPPSGDEDLFFGPTLEEVQNRGFVRCGEDPFLMGFTFQNTTTGDVYGFLVDVCRALAMVVLGDPDKYELVDITSNNRFHKLRDREVDVLMELTTITMGRDIKEGNSNLGMTFSLPFHYTGLAFAGDPIFVECADALNSFQGECRDLKLCVQQGTTHELIMDDIFPGPEKVLTPNLEASVKNRESGKCNVIVNDGVALPETMLRILGYTGPYQLGSRLFSKEPLALATRDGDHEWSQIVNMIIYTLYTAETIGITQESVTSSDVLTDLEAAVEDDHLRSLFLDVVSTVGNMGELYQRHIEAEIPRQGMNLLNIGEEGDGLIYSFPFGDVENSGDLLDGGIIESIVTRQKLRCGISNGLDISSNFTRPVDMIALDMEFCVAVSAALFSSRDARTNVEFVELAEDRRLDALAKGEIDILAGERVSLQRLWQSPTNTSGYSFSPSYFYEKGNGASYALVTLREGEDSQWSEFVYWVVISTFYAEESSITHSTSTELPVVALFGESVKQMFLDAIFEVGNYGDIYNLTVNDTMYPRTGRNMLNLGGTPQIFGHPLL